MFGGKRILSKLFFFYFYFAAKFVCFENDLAVAFKLNVSSMVLFLIPTLICSLRIPHYVIVASRNHQMQSVKICTCKLMVVPFAM